MQNNMHLLKSVNQYIDVSGNIYDMSPNGNIDDMAETKLGNITNAPQTWWNHLSAYDVRIADIIFGGLNHEQRN
jgi:hypothetical protein